MPQNIIQTASSISTGTRIAMPASGNAMFSAFMSGGTGSATVNIYGVVVNGAPAKLLGTLTLSGAPLDAFKVSDEPYLYVYSDVASVSGTVNVVMGA